MGNPMSIHNLLNEAEPEEQRRLDEGELLVEELEDVRETSENVINLPLIRSSSMDSRSLPSMQVSLESYEPRQAYYHSSSSASPDPTIASRRSSQGSPRREFRPIYALEEEHFIWYHRIDLKLDWRQVRKLYNLQFPYRQRRGFQGIQCKYYRCCERHNIPRVRDRSKVSENDRAFGIRQKMPQVYYPWMRDPPPRYFPRLMKL